MNSNLKFYVLDKDYYNFLAQFDDRIMNINDNKSHRPFVGIVFSIDHVDYYAPLTSPKPKHEQMKNQVDFLKINGGLYGAINLNNMLPVVQSAVTLLDFSKLRCDTKGERQYKNLLLNQYRWCQKNSDSIIKRATVLYHMIEDQPRAALKNRCCDFKLLEEKSKLFQQSQPR